jgi:hypothetical protein
MQEYKEKQEKGKIGKALAIRTLHRQCPQWAWALHGDAWSFKKGEIKVVLE